MRSGAEENYIKPLVDYVREVLAGERLSEWDMRSPANRRTLADKFRGCCGLAQCIAGYALQDLELKVSPVATQSLNNYWHGHAVLSAEIGGRLFLIDPTFHQFCGSDFVDGASSPEVYLMQTAQGQEICEQLLEHGCFEITPGGAKTYLAAFCQGQSPFVTDGEALDFLTSPPPHPYHFRRDTNDDSFSRENLNKRGLLINPLQLNSHGLG